MSALSVLNVLSVLSVLTALMVLVVLVVLSFLNVLSFLSVELQKTSQPVNDAKGNRALADPSCWGKDSINPSVHIFAATKGLLSIYTLHIPPELLKKLPLI